MWVVKLGGSLMNSGHLQAWLDFLDQHGKGKVLIVPGGGLFANYIRTMQKNWGFDDKAAHHMALLAMEQTAFYYQSLVPALETARSLKQANNLLEQDKIVIFLTHEFISQLDTIPQDWSFTSDSIAAVISEELRAEGLALIKSLAEIPEVDSIQGLAEAGIVDTLFPEFCRELNCPVHCLAAKDQPKLEKLIFG